MVKLQPLTNLRTLDSQMALPQGEIPTNPSNSLIFDQDQRTTDLRAFMKGLGLDGIIRMNTGHEVLICDYVSSGVKMLFEASVVNTVKVRREGIQMDGDFEEDIEF